jgi:ribosomal protein S6
MNVYELTVIFYPDCDESIVEKILIKVEKIITSSKGKVLRKQKKLGLKD